MALSRRTFLSTLGVGLGGLAAPAGRRLFGQDAVAVAAGGDGVRTIRLGLLIGEACRPKKRTSGTSWLT